MREALNEAEIGRAETERTWPGKLSPRIVSANKTMPGSTQK